MSDAASLPRSLVALMTGLIDYAGLFPPAGLAMSDAVRRYHAHKESREAWALGRFVLPASRLEEFGEALRALPRGNAAAGWELSVLAALPLDDDLERVAAFAARQPRVASAPRVASLEVKAASVDEIAAASARLPREIEVFFEIPWGGGIEESSEAARAAGRAIKLRTGGTTSAAFPPAALVARALAACARADVPFKATAGLHHPLRSSHPVTYEPAAPKALMHGFLNVFVAAILLWTGQADGAAATRLLEDELPGGFEFDDEGLAWRGCRVPVDKVGEARRFARGFGSCSFDEPLADLSRARKSFSIPGSVD